jgi:hypothetical protein
MTDEIRNFGPGKLYIAPPPPAPPSPLDALAAMVNKPIITAEQAALLRQLFQDFGRAAREAAEQLRPIMERLREDLQAAGAIPEHPPEDPKARALWLRQHRNTGPRRPGPQDSPRRRRTDR